ncbi:Cap15 family CBASS effector [Pseudoalteromonas galatheae]|uniref:Cap15 family cyclic dinucleotide receptor domain-containing protein n=1 Tax=Pseudoalteromonas galatheae TaxID=579562 RepID=UPI0030D30830
MHAYSLEGNLRTQVGRWMGVISLSLSAPLTQFIDTFLQPLEIVVTTGLIYLCLHYVFDKWLFRFLPGFPFLAGKHAVTLSTESGQIEADVWVAQTFEKISISLECEHTRSISESVSFVTEGQFCKAVCFYKSQNTQNTSIANQKHSGCCEIYIGETHNLKFVNFYNSLNTHGHAKAITDKGHELQIL